VKFYCELRKINAVLAHVNLVLVVAVWDGRQDWQPTRIYLRSKRANDAHWPERTEKPFAQFKPQEQDQGIRA